jgi:uncharacterized protein YjdB
MDWVYEPDMVGTTGLHKQIEALRFKLVNAPAGYAVTYRVYSEGVGWGEAVSDGQTAGSIGEGKRLEAIQIVISRFGSGQTE